ncbi:twin-arginine translocase TatA/TatE family subunit [Candidatus Woesearchaeota archaeon]|nr:twin-arginine translocase TatA/TatE family subunit [Candidatus Woesearchaeota archaeon]
MGYVGLWEILLILIVILILFGPKRLPQLAKAMGEAWAQFKQASETPPLAKAKPVKKTAKPTKGTKVKG